MTNLIAGTYTTLVTLGTAVDNPTTIASNGLLTDGLSVSYTGLGVVNAGTVHAGSQDAGIYFLTAGSVTNQSGGAISGYDGIEGRSGAVTVVNAGSITATADGDGDGVLLVAGGSVTNQSGGAISGGYRGIYGRGAAVTVVNAGSITGLFDGDDRGVGVELAAGGSVTNQSGGTIYGDSYGIEGKGAAVTVVNAGSIGGGGNSDGVLLVAGGSVTNQSGGAISGDTGIYGRVAAMTVVNAGTIVGTAAGVYLFAGGSVTNQSGGTIIGGLHAVYSGVPGGSYDVHGAMTVVNAGTIIGGYDAVQFAASYANRLVIDPGAVFSGRVIGGNTIGATYVSTLELASAGSAGTLSGLGTQFVDFAQVTVDAGAQWTLTGANILAAGYTLTDAGTLTNAGILSSYGALTLVPGGVLSNASAGTITASNATAVYGAAGGAATVVNAGVITGNTGGIALDAGGSVTNQSGGAIYGSDEGIVGDGSAVTVVNAGSIVGYGIGVYLDAGGGITNQSAAAIYGNGYGIFTKSAAVTVVNAGSIAGRAKGVQLLAGGSVTNQSGGVISSGYDAVLVAYAAVTVVNAGTITGDSDAVKFASGFANRLVIDPGAVFSGKVTGGNAIGASYVSTLELASAGSAGTLSGLGTQFVDFARVTVDAGAQWTLTGANTLAAGYTLTDAGTLTNAGPLSVDSALTLAPGGVLSNASTGTITASDGNAVYGEASGAATVVNAGVIAGDGYGIVLDAGGSVTNHSGGAISGGNDGILGQSGAVTVVNAGSIAGSDVNGILLSPGGRVTNQSGGAISGVDGIEGEDVAVVNAGGITGTADGVLLVLNAGGSVTNQSGGSISGGNYGILGIHTGLNVVNAGSIAGSKAAVQFAAGYTNRLIVDPGAVFTGNVEGGGGVLELASAASGGAASAGTLSGFGTSITNFSALQFDAGAAWTVSGNDSASGLGTIGITGFANGDTIDLAGFVASGKTFANDTLVLTDAGGAQDTLSIQGTFTSGSFQTFTDASGTGTDIIVCFCAGTMIATPADEVPVEKLKIGDLVLTAHNGPRAVTWIGNGKVLATRGRRSAATPVIVRKGALADNVPNADLRVTKAHSLYIDDVLIPVEFLVNYRTILWDDRAQEVDIYHVELDSHDVLIANGAPAESYRDDGNRWLFQNARSGWDLPPQEPYAPVLTGGPIVDAVWRRLLDRTGPHPLPPLTDDPDLHLVVDGTRVDAEVRQGSVYVFRLPPNPASVVIASRVGVPSELGIARDPRSLGVALRRLAVRQGAKFMLFDAADERLTVGFHAYEADGRLRWTDGHAELPAEAFARFNKGAEVMLYVGGATQYPDDRAGAARTAA
jgi:hypothetical protein